MEIKANRHLSLQATRSTLAADAGSHRAAARTSKPRMIQICSAFPLACTPNAASPAVTLAGDDGVVRVKSAYPDGRPPFVRSREI
jgi:hypothetical protein